MPQDLESIRRYNYKPLGMRTDRDFVTHIQHYVARYSVSPSAARGQRRPGVVRAARTHLATVSLRDFSAQSGARFRATLERQTEQLKASLPSGARSWGIARKLLNIFLRNALYTSYLRDHYQLGRAEQWYEIPLDSIVVRQIRESTPGLPRWPGVKHVTPEISSQYQLAACVTAAKLGIVPVHLDAVWWGGPRGRS